MKAGESVTFVRFKSTDIKAGSLLQTIQVFQIILFAIPAMVLVGMGVCILISPLCLIHRRWFLAVFLPFLLANPLAIVANQMSEATVLSSDWRFWLILVADLGLATILLWIYRRGWLMFGFDGDQAASQLAAYFTNQGMKVTLRQEERRSLFGNHLEEQVIRVSGDDLRENLWVMTRSGEVRLQVESVVGSGLIRRALAALRQDTKTSDIKLRAVGVLYIVMAAVIGFLGWIFFFEPRLILLE